jgi:uncharacterized membrane protein
MFDSIKRFIDRNPLGWVLFMLTISVVCTVLCFSGVIVAFVYSTSFMQGLGNALFPMLLAGINMVALVSNVERLAQMSRR